tara:strand:+ start:401 stop:595 length:195 start_codon:yes stop_codon:yes gene_type:complete
MQQITYLELLNIINSLNETKLDTESKKETYTYTLENNKKMYLITVYWMNERAGHPRWDFDAKRI